MNQNLEKDLEQPAKKRFNYSRLSFWIAVVSIICMFGLVFIEKEMFAVGLLGIMVSIILSIIGLFQKNKSFAKASIAINVFAILSIILAVAFIATLVPHS